MSYCKFRDEFAQNSEKLEFKGRRARIQKSCKSAQNSEELQFDVRQAVNFCYKNFFNACQKGLMKKNKRKAKSFGASGG